MSFLVARSGAVLGNAEKNAMPIPRVSVGIPVYNGAKYLQTAVESVLKQDYKNFELIISDNASTDRTPEICREYVAADPRVRYFRNEVNIGAVPNFNRVFKLARGEFFKWLAYDDVCYPSLLSRCVEVLDQQTSSVALVYPLSELIDEHGGVLGEFNEYVETSARQPYQRLWRVLLKRTSALAICGLIRSDHLRRTRLRGSYVMDDMGLLAELAMVGECLKLQDVLLKIRVHPGNANKAHATTRSHAIWLDPENEKRSVLVHPEVGLFLESFRSVMQLRMRPLDKFLCCLTVPLAYLERPFRELGGKWMNRMFQSKIEAVRR
jgi:glycosyltransferase involved in cell wall biosynthesis